MGTKIIYMNDTINDDKVKSLLVYIQAENEYLYKTLIQHFKKDKFSGIRFDVLEFFSNNIERVKKESQFCFYLSSLFGNTNITPEYYLWILDYFDSYPQLNISDFMVIFVSAVEKDIPLPLIMDIFKKGKDDIMAVYEEIDSYTESFSNNEANCESCEVENVRIGDGEVFNRNNNMISAFDDLLTVISVGKNETDSTIIPVKNKFDELITKLQTFITEVTEFSGNVVHEWEKDKEDFIKLKAIYNLQQRVLMSQQQKIYEMRGEISKLKELVHNAEKMELKQQTIFQKVQELQYLSLSDKNNGYLDD